MSAEEDFYLQTLRIGRVQAKLAMAEAIVTLTRQGRVEHRDAIEALARAFNLMPPSFGVGGGHHEHHADRHGHDEGTHSHAHEEHPHPHPHSHPHSMSEDSDGHGRDQPDSGIGLATLISRASAELAEARAGRGKAGHSDSGESSDSRPDAVKAPLISRFGMLTSEGATEIRLAVLKAKIAIAEAVVLASRRAEEPHVCAWIQSLTTAFDELPAPVIIVAETESHS